MKVTAANYEQLRRWFGIVFEAEYQGRDIAAEVHPINMLDATAKDSPARAHAGLEMAIGDMLEMTDHWPTDAVAVLDQDLRASGLPTLSAMRLECSRQMAGIVKRGRIRNDREYYLARNAAEMAGMPEHAIWPLIEAYEARPAGSH